VQYREQPDLEHGSEHGSKSGSAGSLPGFQYAYQARFNINNLAQLLGLVNRCSDGVAVADLVDSYADCRRHVVDLVTAGDVIAVQSVKGKDLANNSLEDRVLFPRNGKYLVDLSKGGVLTGGVRTGGVLTGDVVSTEVDLTKEIRRGEGVCVVQQAVQRAVQQVAQQERQPVELTSNWFRVDSRVSDKPLAEQPSKAKAPASVSFNSQMSFRNQYVRAFDEATLPLDGIYEIDSTSVTTGVTTSATTSDTSTPSTVGNALSAAAAIAPSSCSSEAPDAVTASPAKLKTQVRPCVLRRHGCTTDVKDLFLATVDVVPSGDHDLLKKLVQNKVQGYSEDTVRHKNGRKNNMSKGDLAAAAGAPKKKIRAYVQKSMRTTNAHLNGTKIGDAVARSAMLARKAVQEENARKGGR
jgi:hypothetical protein